MEGNCKKSLSPYLGSPSGYSSPATIVASVHQKHSCDTGTESWVLTTKEIWSYSVGHVLNDLCAACWFTYLLVFLTSVKGLSSTSAGIVMFCGQIADGAATPLVGIFSDMSNGFPSLGLGRRKLWYVVGTILVVLCFTLVWVVDIPELLGAEHDGTAEVLYYATGASVFNVGWASVQVAHMAFVPDLTPAPSERVLLNSYRYGFTVLSNVAVYVAFLAFVSLMRPVGGVTELKFSWVGSSVLLLGALTSLLFLTGVHESTTSSSSSTSSSSTSSSSSSSSTSSSSSSSFSSPSSPCSGYGSGTGSGGGGGGADCDVEGVAADRVGGGGAFYYVAVVYMLVRMATCLSQVYIPLYLTHTVRMDTFSLAVVPMVMYLFSFGMTMIQPLADRVLGRTKSFCLGALLSTLACVGFYLAPQQADWPLCSLVLVYGSAGLLGVGGTGMMVGAVSLQSDLVGDNVCSGAFVYGAHSFFDKMANGVAIMGIQVAQQNTQDPPRFPGDSDNCYSDTCQSFLRVALCVATGIAAVLGILLVVAKDVLEDRTTSSSFPSKSPPFGGATTQQQQKKSYDNHGDPEQELLLPVVGGPSARQTAPSTYYTTTAT